MAPVYAPTRRQLAKLVYVLLSLARTQETRSRYSGFNTRAVRVAQYLVILCATTFSACTKDGTIVQADALTGGDAPTGKKLIYSFACGSCHIIPGVADAAGTVGPPLQGFASRIYIAGSLVNTPENLSRWIKHPPQIKSGTAMPDLGVSDEQVRHIAAYLYTLH